MTRHGISNSVSNTCFPKQVPGSPCPSCTDIYGFNPDGSPIYRCYHGQFQGYICYPDRCSRLTGRRDEGDELAGDGPRQATLEGF